jgi:SNF2 family DNA or RNA helicase
VSDDVKPKTVFIPGGPERFPHQKRGLKKIIETRGVCALLFDPGLGKTATTLDFASLLALKAPHVLDSFGRQVREARILVVAPLAAVDTWVLQSDLWVSPQVDFWAEALGGTIQQRAEAIASRGGQPFRPKKGARKNPYAKRALHVDKSFAWSARSEGRSSDRPITRSEGPDGLGDRPRIVLIATNFDTFASRQQVKGMSKPMSDHLLDAVRRFNPDLLVVDEMHKIKGPTSNTGRLLGRVAEYVPRRIGLTGTPMPNGPLDIFGQWRFLEPFAFGDLAVDGSRKRATFGAFKDKYAVMGGYMGREVKGFRNLDEMQSIMSTNSSVARKRDELKFLPPDQDTEVMILLNPRELKAYNDMKKGLATKLTSGNGVQNDATAGSRLTQMLRLRQITAGHLPDDNGNLHLLGTSKVDAIQSLVHDTLVGEDRVVVFCYFKEEVAQLRTKLADKQTEIMVVDGETPSTERLTMRQRFGDRSVKQRIVMIAQIRTMSLAVNELVTASNAVFASLPQTRDDIVQARDRLNRIGQTLPTTFWFVLAPGTVDTVIYRSYKDKTSLEEAVLAHILDLDPSTESEKLEFQPIPTDIDELVGADA